MELKLHLPSVTAGHVMGQPLPFIREHMHCHMFFLFPNFENLLLDYIHSLVLKDKISYMTYEVKPQSSGPHAIGINLAHKSNEAGFCLFM